MYKILLAYKLKYLPNYAQNLAIIFVIILLLAFAGFLHTICAYFQSLKTQGRCKILMYHIVSNYNIILSLL